MATVTNPIMWTIKSIAEEAKDHALAEAKAAGVPVGIWLEKLLLGHKEGRPTDVLAPPLVDLRPLAEIMRASADIMQSSGAPIPKAAVKHAYSLLGLELRQARHVRKEQIQQPKHHAAAISGPGSDRGSSGMTPANAKSDV